MPRFLARTNRHGAPVAALIMAAGLISILLVALLFAADALDFMLDLTAALSLIPYLLAAAYAVKLTVTRETYDDGKKSRVPDMIVAAVATAYTLFLVSAAGVDKLLLSCVLYAPAAALYFTARRERGLRIFRPAEAVLFGVIVIGGDRRCGVLGQWGGDRHLTQEGGDRHDECFCRLWRSLRSRKAAQGSGVFTRSGPRTIDADQLR